MNLPSTTAVVAAALLACSAANAQPAPTPAPAAASAPSEAPAATATTTATTTVGADGVRNTLVASSPVPDTPENRAKYGKPMSHAGRHTKAAGN
jgi:hypothetical protein